jgi:hypothetical protein
MGRRGAVLLWSLAFTCFAIASPAAPKSGAARRPTADALFALGGTDQAFGTGLRLLDGADVAVDVAEVKRRRGMARRGGRISGLRAAEL